MRENGVPGTVVLVLVERSGSVMRSRLTDVVAGRARVLLVAMTALALGPASALAATVQVGPEGIVYRAAPHEVNDVTMRDAGPAPPRRSVVEATAHLTLGPGCDAGTPILCSDLSHHKDVLLLGDRDDSANYFSNFADSYVFGAQGNDDVVSAGSQHMDGGGRRVGATGLGRARGRGIGRSRPPRPGEHSRAARLLEAHRQAGPENAAGTPRWEAHLRRTRGGPAPCATPSSTAAGASFRRPRAP